MKCLYSKTSKLAKKIVRQKNEKKEATYFMPTKYISYEISELSALFSLYFESISKGKCRFLTFFASSNIEAINGTIKIFRHNAFLRKTSGDVLIFGLDQQLRYFFNPLSVSSEKSLVPGLRFVSDIEEMRSIIKSNNIIGLIFCRNGHDTDTLLEIREECYSRNILFALNDSYVQDWHSNHFCQKIFDKSPDVFILGENILNYEIPFSSFSMRSDIFSPWDNIENCLNHSSSNSGNTLALSAVLSVVNRLYSNISHKIPNDMDHRISLYARYVNPIIGRVFSVLDFSPDIVEANGAHLKVITHNKEVKDVIDCVGGSGSSARGHNPKDIPEIIDKHEDDKDYWEELKDEICKKTGMYHVFPSISGSSAVDIAISSCLMAAYPKTCIVTFSGNYAGKSLIALNMTRFCIYQQSFAPLYFDVVELNPFDPRASEKFIAICNERKVAVVWFEVLRGQDSLLIPDELLSTIVTQKAHFNYFIATDEVLTGMYRTGEFLISLEKNIPFDAAVVGKGLTDMSFPFGIAAVSKEIYEKCLKYDDKAVKFFSYYYRNQLGSHIALNALKKVQEGNISEKVLQNGKFLHNELDRIVKRNSLLRQVRGQGFLQHVVMNKDSILLRVFGEEIVEFLLSGFFLKYHNILILNSRLTPSLYITKEDIRKVCSELEKGWGNRYKLFYYCLVKSLRIYLCIFLYKLKKKLLHCLGGDV